jgi:DNA-directed RNA polymerase subunit RPC12/RpoP
MKKTIICSNCGDEWYLPFVSLTDWEIELTKQGVGCPECLGRDLKDRYSKSSPLWKRPEPEVIWTCDNCGIKVVKDPDDGMFTFEGCWRSNFFDGSYCPCCNNRTRVDERNAEGFIFDF